ncbi:CsbD family protein [Herbaspirillum sp. alder98]|uniref:CsbD family protein n=1 Tax=Herbaspirillum sp. alder98 TaxID=2913096 RepID=UPI001CD81CBF|nr:CsbD family protein [Herbaspirillum sp. alder98]MCA1323472.1 CsbD family protein [Herbaspirillum sp. alder98]
MNRNMIAGQAQVVVGKVQEKLAMLIGHAEMQRSATQRQTQGRIKHAVGEAQDLIRRSLRQRRVSM